MIEYLSSITVAEAVQAIAAMSAYDALFWIFIAYIARLILYSILGGIIGLIDGFRI